MTGRHNLTQPVSQTVSLHRNIRIKAHDQVEVNFGIKGISITDWKLPTSLLGNGWKLFQDDFYVNFQRTRSIFKG